MVLLPFSLLLGASVCAPTARVRGSWRPLDSLQLSRWNVLTIDELKRELALGNVHPAYLVEGEGAAEKERVFQIMEEALVPPTDRDLCLSTFDGDQCAATEVLETLQTVPFIGERRLVYLRRFDHMAAQDQELIAEACKKGFAGSVLLLSADSLDKRRATTKALLESVVHIEITLPRGEDLVRWTMGQAARLGIEIERGAAALLAQQGGDQPDGLLPELEKIATYVGRGGVATVDDVLSVLATAAPWAAENEIFQFCDATAEGRLQAALAGLDRLLGTGAHPIYVLTMLARHFRHLLAVKGFGGRDAERMRRELGFKMRTFGVERLVRQATRFSLEQLESALELLLEADLQLKRGAAPRTALERVTVALATLHSPF